MNRMYFTLYRDQVMNLARSVVIKMSHIAEASNRGLREQGYIIGEDPTTWKYYLNLAGEYHSSDTLMTVRSMDTLEIIDFTKENLNIHRATAREYAPGGLYHKNLLTRYPLQADLIAGILAPVDITTAIEASNGTVLYYDPRYVEDNEENFAAELQAYVTTFMLRWFNEQYLLIDDLYLPVQLGLLYANLPMMIMNLRLRNARTPFAHSFHIREYLASNGRLDGFIPYLTKKQQLWLYRNLRFLQRNVGKQEIFERLVANILTPRGIPLISYELRQNVTPLPEAIYPTVELVKQDVNFNVVQPGLDKVEVGVLLEREAEIARENPLVQYDTEQAVIDGVRSNHYSQLNTKVLDSEVVDRSNSSVRSLFNVLLNEWVHLACTNRYRAYVTVPNPRTGDYMAMTVRDALVVALYAYYKTREEVPASIPRVIAYDVLRSPLPAFNELSGIVDSRWVPDGMIQAIMDRVTPLTEYISTEQFYLDCVTAHRDYLKLWELYSFQEHHRTRCFCEQLVRRHYMHIMCSPVDDTVSFEAFFKASGYDLLDLDNAELEQLLLDTVNIATGSNLVRVITLGEIQRELLALMGKLSSYPLQYLRNVSYTDFHVLGMPAVRVGDIEVETESHDFIVAPTADVTAVQTSTATEYDITQEDISPPISLEVETQTKYVVDSRLKITEDLSSMGHFRLNAMDVTVRSFRYVTEQEPNESDTTTQYTPSTDPEWPTLE